MLSTLHTNDAPSTITRLLNMGAPPYLLASALIGVLAQRLVRRVCPHCQQRRATTELERTLAGGLEEVVDATGCARCHYGYRGRSGVYEVMSLSLVLRDLVSRRAPADVLRRRACENGMLSLADDALRLLRGGLTTLAETRPYLLSRDGLPVASRA